MNHAKIKNVGANTQAEIEVEPEGIEEVTTVAQQPLLMDVAKLSDCEPTAEDLQALDRKIYGLFKPVRE